MILFDIQPFQQYRHCLQRNGSFSEILLYSVWLPFFFKLLTKENKKYCAIISYKCQRKMST